MPADMESDPAERARRERDAKDAFARGHAALAAGDKIAATRWLERAHRLAPHDGTISLVLASAAIGIDNPRAATLFSEVLAGADVRDAWLGLATARLLMRDIAGACSAIGTALGRHARVARPWRRRGSGDAVGERAGLVRDDRRRCRGRTPGVAGPHRNPPGWKADRSRRGRGSHAPAAGVATGGRAHGHRQQRRSGTPPFDRQSAFAPRDRSRRGPRRSMARRRARLGLVPGGSRHRPASDGRNRRRAHADRRQPPDRSSCRPRAACPASLLYDFRLRAFRRRCAGPCPRPGRTRPGRQPGDPLPTQAQTHPNRRARHRDAHAGFRPHARPARSGALAWPCGRSRRPGHARRRRRCRAADPGVRRRASGEWPPRDRAAPDAPPRNGLAGVTVSSGPLPDLAFELPREQPALLRLLRGIRAGRGGVASFPQSRPDGVRDHSRARRAVRRACARLRLVLPAHRFGRTRRPLLRRARSRRL